MNLRPYQDAAEESLRALFAGGKKRVLLVSPTGSGKTVILASIIRKAAALGNPTLFLAHRKELIDQASARLDAVGVDHGIVMSGHPRTAPGLSVQVASVQTLARREELPPARIVIIDEAHRARATTYGKILDRYPDAIVLGATASPWRNDGQGLGELFEDLVLAARPRELVDQGFLVPYTGFAYDHPDTAAIDRRGTDFDGHGLELVMGSRKLVGNIVQQYLEHAPGQLAVVFAVSVAHSIALRDRFLEAGVPAAHLDGDTPAGERTETLRRMARGEIRVLCNVNLVTEGWDLPALQLCILARPTLSTTLYLQMCLDASTEILTRRGWMGPDDIRDDDMVAAFDKENDTASWEPILSRVDRQKADGESMFGIQSPSLDLRVTDAHTMVYRTRKGKGWRTAEAREVAKMREIYLPVAATQKALGLPLSDDELRFIGWFLSDGSRNIRTNAISIYQAENSPFIKDIESCLIGCGFKYGKHVRWPEGSFTPTARRVQFTVSMGAPRGRDSHLRGWKALERYIDKDLAPALEDVDFRQLGVMLEAVHMGDGHKQVGQSWTPRSYHISTGNKTFAERLQSLCVRRGWRCNIGIHSYNAKPLYLLHMKPDPVRAAGGAGAADRESFKELPAVQGERVWCIENRLGTIFVRRNGKVAIVGNCGRVLRPAPGKTVARIHDHAGNFAEHGAPDADRDYSLTADLRPKAGKKEKLPPIRTCEECLRIYDPTLSDACPSCGHQNAAAARAPKELDDDKVRRIPLSELPQFAAASDSQKRSAYQKWLADALAAGKKPGMAAHKYRAVYGHWPPRSWSQGAA